MTWYTKLIFPMALSSAEHSLANDELKEVFRIMLLGTRNQNYEGYDVISMSFPQQGKEENKEKIKRVNVKKQRAV